MGKKKKKLNSSKLREENIAIYGQPWPKPSTVPNKKKQANKKACKVTIKELEE